MKKRNLLAIVVIMIVGFYFAAPVQSATVPGGCAGCYVHYHRSLSC
ncbi:MAG: hypothetical protein M1368_10540 [Thaumarchaeota archaeon]|nr:hypothetical protein [Nitrososphaerota archaeon]